MCDHPGVTPGTPSAAIKHPFFGTWTSETTATVMAKRIHGLVGNGRWTGVPVRTLLNEVGVKPAGREVVFFGADKGEEEVEFRGRTYNVEQEFGRSISIETAMTGEPLLAYALNGEPLTRHQGFPLRVIMPGWYGVANVKWLAHIHVQEKRYLGKYQAPLAPHSESGNDRRRSEVQGNRHQQAAVEVGHRPRYAGRKPAQGFSASS